MDWSPETVDAASCGWALVETHIEGRDDVRAILLGAGSTDFWRAVANHCSEQLAFRCRREFADNSAELVGRIRGLVLAGGATSPGSTS